MILGCGNSALSRDLADDGYHNVVSLDYSRVCIESMRRLHASSHPDLVWVEGDVRDLPFPDASFDLAIDKGTLDALIALGPCVYRALHTADDAAATMSGHLRSMLSRAYGARSTRLHGVLVRDALRLTRSASSIKTASSCISRSVSPVR